MSETKTRQTITAEERLARLIDSAKTELADAIRRQDRAIEQTSWYAGQMQESAATGNPGSFAGLVAQYAQEVQTQAAEIQAVARRLRSFGVTLEEIAELEAEAR